MTVITPAPELVQQIETLAATAEVDADILIDKAVRAYILQVQREKIRVETDAFHAQYEQLRSKYLGHYVAIHQGKVIDNDPDLRTLHLRVFKQLGHTPVLLRQVTDKQERQLVFRSPRLERLE